MKHLGPSTDLRGGQSLKIFTADNSAHVYARVDSSGIKFCQSSDDAIIFSVSNVSSGIGAITIGATGLSTNEGIGGLGISGGFLGDNLGTFGVVGSDTVSTASHELDFSVLGLRSVLNITYSGAITLTASVPLSDYTSAAVVLVITNTSGVAANITWPSSFHFGVAGPPKIANGATVVLHGICTVGAFATANYYFVHDSATPIAALDTSGTASSSTVLRGDGAWSDTVAGAWNVNGHLYVGGNLTLDTGAVSLPSGVLSHSYLASGSACSVLGRSANSTGALASIQLSTNNRLLGRVGNTLQETQLTAGMVPNNLVSNAMFRDSSACSILGRSANSSGDPADIASVGSGDVLFRENNTLVFDNWIRQRRNISRGFWDFEFGNGDPQGTSLGDAVRIYGTPFVTQKVGNGLISQASRGNVFSRNCLTLGCYTVDDEAGFYAIDAATATCGLPTGVGTVIMEMGVRCNTLSASLNDYVLNLGFVSDATIDGKGVYFQYDRATSGNVWRIIAKNSSQSTTVTASTVAVSTEYRLRIEVTASNSATFYVNGTSIGTITSNIPSLLGLGAMLKRSTSSASAAAYWDVDYIGYQLSYSTPRSATQR